MTQTKLRSLSIQPLFQCFLDRSLARFLACCFWAALLVHGLPARADEPQATQQLSQPPFQAGIESYQKQDYSAAQTQFEAALQEHPTDASILTNLALTHYRLGHRGWALGYARKALHLEPGFSDAEQLIEAIAKEGKVRDLPHRIELWELLHQHVLSAATVPLFATLLLLLFVATAWAWLSFLGVRRRALASETALPGFPFLPALFTVLLIVSLLLMLAKIKDAADARGTIVVEKVSALTAPSDQSPSLFELLEGLEVVIRKSEGDWLQVTFPGAMTGWIPKNSLFQTHGSPN
jgi:tetratricopeptide (TPR) repeat protein